GPIVADLHSLDYPVAAIAAFDSGYWATPSRIELAVRIAAMNGGFAPVSIVARLAPFFDPVAPQITTSARSFAAVAVVDALTVGAAAVGVVRVAVIANFSGFRDAVATTGAGSTGATTSARTAEAGLHRGTIEGTTVTGNRSTKAAASAGRVGGAKGPVIASSRTNTTIVAGFVGILDNAITTFDAGRADRGAPKVGLDGGAVGTAPVTIARVIVVTRFTWLKNAVATVGTGLSRYGATPTCFHRAIDRASVSSDGQAAASAGTSTIRSTGRSVVASA